ncbi:MAG: hypothetical protein NVSMB27_04450 [Ktedonobacteraceae bacterium]
MATKQLRLDVAQLTDVGRKREHNEDNMAYVIPKDQQIMAKKGALFIVADGMGGHAAGEVASEIAVDTVSNVYYQDDSDDIAISLLHAIKRANALIHQRASENMLRSGMGTTCVAAVLRGNMAYIANVGDSRAYIVRHGQIKQVSQDHSWVAEQVRAGLLTEDQARTHAQRNVITRCLGTQADVEIDVFPEAIEEKDALVLCTDGLSAGQVSDDEIRKIVDQTAPQESVYHLVERANENGGPDNITAIVVSVQEVGPEPPGVRRPVPVGGRETGEDTVLLGLPPGSPAPLAAAFGDTRTPSNPLRYPSGPLLSPDTIVTAPQPALQVPQRGRSRLFYPTLAILTLLVLAAIGGGGYLYLKNTAGVNVAQDLQQAQNSIAKANREVSASPTTALHDLASAQTTLRSLQQNISLTNDQHQKVLSLLQGDFTRGVQSAIVSYNQQAGITVLCSSNTTSHTVNQGTVGTQPKLITQVTGKGKGTALLYALGQDNKVYQVNNNTSLIQVALPLTAETRVLALASNGTQLLFLLSQPGRVTNPAAGTLYSVALYSPDQTKPQQPQFDATTPIDATFVKGGQVPKLIAASGTDVYVVFGSTSTQTTTLIVDYSSSKAGKPLAQATAGNFSFSDSIVSLAAFPNHELFVLLAGGTVQSLLFASNNQPATSVFVQSAIAQPLPISSKAFTWQTPVPSIISGGTKSLAVPEATSPDALAAGAVNGVPHLFIMDAAQHRILDLKVASGGSAATPTVSITPTSTSVGGQAVGSVPPVIFQVQEQYASSSLLAQPRSMAVDNLGSQIDVLAQNTSSILTLLSFNSGLANNCA